MVLSLTQLVLMGSFATAANAQYGSGYGSGDVASGDGDSKDSSDDCKGPACDDESKESKESDSSDDCKGPECDSADSEDSDDCKGPACDDSSDSKESDEKKGDDDDSSEEPARRRKKGSGSGNSGGSNFKPPQSGRPGRRSEGELPAPPSGASFYDAAEGVDFDQRRLDELQTPLDKLWQLSGRYVNLETDDHAIRRMGSDDWGPEMLSLLGLDAPAHEFGELEAPAHEFAEAT